MRVLGWMAENYMRVRVIEVEPKGRITKFTGKNGQGKTSAVDSLMVALLGRKAQKDKPVRAGASKAKLQVALGDDKVELKLIRTITPDGVHTLDVQSTDGTKIKRPQEMLDALLGEGAADPLEFMRLKPKEQAERLRKLAKVDLDFEAIAAANAADFEARRVLNVQVRQLEAEAASITVQLGLPKEKLDETTIMAELAGVSAKNDAQREVERHKERCQRECSTAAARVAAAQREITDASNEVMRLEQALKVAKARVAEAKKMVEAEDEALTEAKRVYEVAPDPQYVDAGEITQRLQQAQVANREIDKRERRHNLEQRARTTKREADKLTAAMEEREAMKLKALREAKIPVEGVEITEDGALVNGIPLNQLGEAEQLRICASIFMASEPKLRIMPIWHGEALDPDNMAMLEQLCEEHDFHIVMAMVDASGKVGIVMEDGEVAAEND